MSFFYVPFLDRSISILIIEIFKRVRKNIQEEFKRDWKKMVLICFVLFLLTTNSLNDPNHIVYKYLHTGSEFQRPYYSAKGADVRKNRIRYKAECFAPG